MASDQTLLAEIVGLVRALDQKLTRHMEGEEGELHETNRRLDSLAQSFNSYAEKHDCSIAFPGGDMAGHRTYHEQVIDVMKKRTELIEDIKKNVARWGVLGILTWIAVQLWQAFLRGPT